MEKLTLDDHHLYIIAKLREAFPKASRHQNFGKRAVDVFRKALPEYEITAGSCGEMLLTLKIWQGWDKPGTTIDYDNRLSLSWNTYQVPWSERFLEELNRQDPSDGIEREKEEGLFFETFSEFEQEIATLQRAALDLIKTLPIPKAAVKANFRASSTFWDTPRASTKKKFPLLFS